MNQTLATDALTRSMTEVVDALHSSAFPAALVRLIQQQVAFDCALLLGVGQRPVYLYDNLNHQRALLFDRYLTSHFSQDRHHFYQATGWQEEVGLILPVRDGLTLMLFLGRLDKRSTLSRDELARLEQLFPLVHSLCRQQWRQSQPLLALSPVQPDGTDLKGAVEQAIASVGGDRLTRRERQVAGLLLQGLDTEGIAATLGIGCGTVKNHRKHLYSKLHLRSRAELFHFFLNHLITTEGGR